MADAKEKWLQETLGVAAKNLSLKTAEPARIGPANAPGEVTTPKETQKKREEAGHKFDFAKPLLKGKIIKAWGGRIELQPQLVVSISGRIGINDTKQPDYSVIEKVAARLVIGQNGIESGNLLQNLELKTSLTSIAIESFTETKIGKFSLKLELLGLHAELSQEDILAALKVMELEVQLAPARIQVPEKVLQGTGLLELEIAVAGKLIGAPGWKKIIGSWLIKKLGIKIVEEGGKKLATAAVGEVSVDAVMTVAVPLAIGAAGIAALAGAIHGLRLSWDLKDIGENRDRQIPVVLAGCRAGLSGDKEPGDRIGKTGYELGLACYNAMFGKIKKQNPAASDEAIKKAIAGQADAILGKFKVEIEKKIRLDSWARFVEQHSGIMDSSADIRNGFVACFGYDPTYPGGAHNYDDEWKKWLAKQGPWTRLAYSKS